MDAQLGCAMEPDTIATGFHVLNAIACVPALPGSWALRISGFPQLL